MAKITGNYEVVYIIDAALSEEETAALVAKFQTLAEQNGTAVEVDEWGKRKLAYLINDEANMTTTSSASQSKPLQEHTKRV